LNTVFLVYWPSMGEMDPDAPSRPIEISIWLMKNKDRYGISNQIDIFISQDGASQPILPMLENGHINYL